MDLEFWGQSQVCKETPRPGRESWLPFALGWVPRGRDSHKEGAPCVQGSPKEPERRDGCTAAWGNELTVRGQGSSARDTVSLAEATDIVYTEAGLEKEGEKASA